MKLQSQMKERERYAIDRGEEIEAGDDEVSEGEAVDLLVLILPRQKLVHHL